MHIKCTACNGEGHIIIDCPYCRNSDPHEHLDLKDVTCKCCNDLGITEDTCPICEGTGYILRQTPTHTAI